MTQTTQPAPELRDLSDRLDKLAEAVERLTHAVDVLSLGPDSLLSFAHQGETVKLHLPDAAIDFIQRRICANRSFYEAHLLEKVRPYIAPGGVIVDAGANIGNHAVYFAMFCGAAKVLAIEPQPHCSAILERNIKANGLGDVIELRRTLLGREPGRGALMRSNPGNLGNASFGEAAEGRFPVTSLDALLGETKVDLVKIDVEGMQMEVLDGARQTLARHRPMLWIELRRKRGEYDAAAAVLMKMGYSALELGANDHLFVHDAAGT